MKKRFCRLVTVFMTAAVMAAALPVGVFADTVTAVVMTYEDKVYAKDLYGIEVEQIRQGVETDGLKDIGGLIDSLTFLTNGEQRFDKAAVTAAVKSAIMAGETHIKIDLSKYKEGAVSVTPANTGEANAQTATAVATVEAVAGGIKLSEASTKFRANEDRAKNIRNAASKINGMMILPGQLFSANTAFGPRTVANGYGFGNVISGDTYVKGLGGGICQVSSTLNLAVLRAGIIPVERHNHSHRSSYIASGLDATISGASMDYKFINPYDSPIFISAVTNGGVITISIVSTEDILKGIVYEPSVAGGKMSNTTHVIGTFAGMQVSDRVAYSSRYKQ